VKKARKAGLLTKRKGGRARSRAAVGRKLFELAKEAQGRGWSAEDLLRAEIRREERGLRKKERKVK